MAQCKKCGSKDVEWVKRGNQWLLYETKTGEWHKTFCQMTQDEYLKTKNKPMPQQKAPQCKHGILLDRICPLCEGSRNKLYE